MDRLRIIDKFHKRAHKLRAEFEARFKDPRSTNSKRFIWDYWSIDDQYLLLRTPAQDFFSPQEFSALTGSLLEYGRRHLGCNAISPPWLSLYVDGCFQGLHADVPHGPWAYVYSLTPKISFKGGETLLVKDRLLNYWGSQRRSAYIERTELVDKVTPRFNRLTLFDPRIPHGVERVSGVHDPLKARLVVHGWFTDPRPQVEGALPALKCSKILNELVRDSLEIRKPRFSEAQGILIVRLVVTPKGQFRQLQTLTDNLRDQQGNRFSARSLLLEFEDRLNKIEFPKTKRGGALILPLSFSTDETAQS